MKKDKIIKKISIALDKIRPYLQEDGGDIEFVSLDDDNSVKIRFQGNCIDCDVNMMTLKNGVEVEIRRAFPDLKEVIDVT